MRRERGGIRSGGGRGEGVRAKDVQLTGIMYVAEGGD